MLRVRDCACVPLLGQELWRQSEPCTMWQQWCRHMRTLHVTPVPYVPSSAFLVWNIVYG